MSDPEYREDAEELISLCREKDVGTMVIKSVTKGPWGEKEKTATTWYEPFDEKEKIQNAVNFALSYEVTGLCTAGDVHILPMMLEACENFTPLDTAQMDEMIKSGSQYEPLFT
jgi:hypothetical protein